MRVKVSSQALELMLNKVNKALPPTEDTKQFVAWRHDSLIVCARDYGANVVGIVPAMVDCEEFECEMNFNLFTSACDPMIDVTITPQNNGDLKVNLGDGVEYVVTPNRIDKMQSIDIKNYHVMARIRAGDLASAIAKGLRFIKDDPRTPSYLFQINFANNECMIEVTNYQMYAAITAKDEKKCLEIYEPFSVTIDEDAARILYRCYEGELYTLSLALKDNWFYSYGRPHTGQRIECSTCRVENYCLKSPEIPYNDQLAYVYCKKDILYSALRNLLSYASQNKTKIEITFVHSTLMRLRYNHPKGMISAFVECEIRDVPPLSEQQSVYVDGHYLLAAVSIVGGYSLNLGFKRATDGQLPDKLIICSRGAHSVIELTDI